MPSGMLQFQFCTASSHRRRIERSSCVDQDSYLCFRDEQLVGCIMRTLHLGGETTQIPCALCNEHLKRQDKRRR